MALSYANHLLVVHNLVWVCPEYSKLGWPFFTSIKTNVWGIYLSYSLPSLLSAPSSNSDGCHGRSRMLPLCHGRSRGKRSGQAVHCCRGGGGGRWDPHSTLPSISIDRKYSELDGKCRGIVRGDVTWRSPEQGNYSPDKFDPIPRIISFIYQLPRYCLYSLVMKFSSSVWILFLSGLPVHVVLELPNTGVGLSQRAILEAPSDGGGKCLLFSGNWDGCTHCPPSSCLYIYIYIIVFSGSYLV